jgi:superfamily II DNA/RNA helicase
VTHCPSNEDTVKRAVLRTIIKAKLTDQGIVFCNRKREVDVVAKSLSSHGFDASPIHGDLPQSVRTATLEKFRSKQLKLLVASDVAARGLDIPEVSQVFNYAPPPNSDDYVHRIGRTGRAGRSGESFTIVSPGDARLWDAVLKRIGKDVVDFNPDGLEDAVGEAKARGPAPKRDRFERSGRGGGREGGRGRERGPRREEAAPEPLPPSAAIPAALAAEAESRAEPEAPARERSERPRRERGSGRGPDKAAERPAASEESRVSSRPARERGRKPPQDERARRERTDDDDRGARTKGMGDHVPAFLLRQAKPHEDA